MLPSIRLIVTTFLCGFMLVFAGLRLVNSLNSMHAALPVTAAHAAPAPGAGGTDWPSLPATSPVLYDLRFVPSTASPTTASLLMHDIDRSMPVSVPATVKEIAHDPAPTPLEGDVEPVEVSHIVTATLVALPVTEPTNRSLPSAPQIVPEIAAEPDTQPAAAAAVDSQAAPPDGNTKHQAMEIRPVAAEIPTAAGDIEVSEEDIATTEPSRTPNSDEAMVVTPPGPATATAATAPTDQEKPDDTANAPSQPSAVDVASLASESGSAEIEEPNSVPGPPVMVTIVMPKPRPVGEVLQTKSKSANKRRTGRTQWTAQRDTFYNRPFGGFDDWQHQRR
jgi:hypothetical protein